ncbi:EpsG family protein [Bacillus sp. FJAT-42376]|uniref:EpsG family protein n=1 Tax=Bacillus sp. FJAT-42376 TaxID=2014076 RepID=UPI000F4E6D24|nr:EpsG family protein [Bacillus sp. FJAT-42376]AZB43590.1 EpsG family protein [Bacillus sp. FJAT-42376]
MTILWLLLFAVFLLSSFSRYFATDTQYGILGIQPNRLLILMVMILFSAVAGLRNNIGDTFFYAHAYMVNDYDWNFIFNNKDIAFGILQMALQHISDDPQILILTTAIITNILVIQVLNQYSRVVELSTYLYVTSGLFTVSMNGIRQFLAASIIFGGTILIFKGKRNLYFMLVIFASFFHLSALVLIPVYFLVRKKAWRAETFILLFLAVAAIVSFNQFSEGLFSLLQGTQYQEYREFSEGGASYVRVLVNAAPLIIAFLGRERFKEIFPQSDIIVNMSILGLIIMIISTQNWIFARFSIYFGLYNLILISWLPKLFKRKDEKLVYFMILIFYLIYFFYEQVISLDLDYKSDFLNLSYIILSF